MMVTAMKRRAGWKKSPNICCTSFLVYIEFVEIGVGATELTGIWRRGNENTATERAGIGGCLRALGAIGLGRSAGTRTCLHAEGLRSTCLRKRNLLWPR